MTVMRLDELTQEYDGLARAFEEACGEVTPELKARLDTFNWQEKERIDRTIFHLKALQGEAEDLKKLEDQLAAKRKAKLRARENLLKYVQWYMLANEHTEIKGSIFRFQLQFAGKAPVEVLVPVESLPRIFTKVTIEADKEALRDGISKGIVPEEMARLGEMTQSVRMY